MGGDFFCNTMTAYQVQDIHERDRHLQHRHTNDVRFSCCYVRTLAHSKLVWKRSTSLDMHPRFVDDDRH